MLKFLGIGAQKAGTTWLYNTLNQHPLINFPKGKEAHFWNSEINNDKINNYLSCFSDPLLVEGEITPAYGHLAKDRIEVVHSYLPDAKIIYIMRDPIQRAWSSALMALKRSEMIIDEASDQWFIDHFMSSGSLSRGDYEASLQNWISVYSTNRVLPLFFEDMVAAPEAFIKEIFQFLEMKIPDDNLIAEWEVDKKIFPGCGEKIRPQLKDFLNSAYQKKVINLEQYLKVDLSSKWGGWWDEDC